MFGEYRLYCGGEPTLLFCDNDTNLRRLYGLDVRGYFKDAFHEFLVHGRKEAVCPEQEGTKAGVDYRLDLPARASAIAGAGSSGGRTDAPWRRARVH